MTDWQRRDYPGSDAPFRIAETLGPVPSAHDRLDAVRMYWRRTPEAQYPDGYLGTVNTRRGDRLLDGLKSRTQNRPNTRGIHKGERLDMRDYFWPAEFNQWSGLEAQARGEKFVSPGFDTQILDDERYATNKKVGPRSVPVGSRYANTAQGPQGPTNADRLPVLRGQAPPWSTGRANPGMAVPYPGRP